MDSFLAFPAASAVQTCPQAYLNLGAGCDSRDWLGFQDLLQEVATNSAKIGIHHVPGKTKDHQVSSAHGRFVPVDMAQQRMDFGKMLFVCKQRHPRNIIEDVTNISLHILVSSYFHTILVWSLLTWNHSPFTSLKKDIISFVVAEGRHGSNSQLFRGVSFSSTFASLATCGLLSSKALKLFPVSKREMKQVLVAVL